MRSPRGVAVSIAAVLLIALSGCGDEDPEDGGRPPVAGPGEGGELAYALATAPAEVDPLLASDRSSLLVTRQIHEPLVGTVTGPFGDLRTFQGLAQAYRPSGDRTIWRFELRPRVRFQDGTPFNAAAVLANAERWQALARGRRLLGDVIAIDAPTTDLVRFVLASPDPDFPSRLTAPELGIVSPNAISADHPSRRVTRDERTGTGPFELRTLTESDALIVRNVDWWGAAFGLGPALDQIEFPVVADVPGRLDLLDAGEVEAADSLDGRAVSELRQNPLLTVEKPPEGPLIGLERSVRGLRFSHGLPLLSGVWLTTVGVAG